MNDGTEEAISAVVHAAWMAMKQSKGVESRLSEQGEELMKPYADLSEAAKDLDRGTVRAVLAALPEAGFELRRAIPDDPVKRGHGPGTIPPGAMADMGPTPKMATTGGFHHAADGRPLHPLAECRPGTCWTDEPTPATACQSYDGGKNYGLYLNGDPCQNCRKKAADHPAGLVEAWVKKSQAKGPMRHA